MSHLDAPQSKRIKLTQDEDTKRENAIDNGRSVANSKGKARQQTITIMIYIYIDKVLP